MNVVLDSVIMPHTSVRLYTRSIT